ncbi:uncharacterized protein LOC130720022 [Lotus japonicus]|uniref:uncharacterized protein LOC130720022 n=1 Tax=Lotus japonicus TaxID=34305 RepID=UPI00258C4816|nr:uncharacterized protein LOC130720022 [Lotus japonicus]
MLNLITWNVRGAAAKGFPLLIKDLVYRHRVSCVALFETRVSGSRAKAIVKSLGFDQSFIVEAEGFAGGIWILWKGHEVQVEVLRAHRQFVHASITPFGCSNSFLATFVSGSPNSSIRNVLWSSLVELQERISPPWIVLGDFNAYLGADEKYGGAGANTYSMRCFRECLERCQLSDMGFKGPPFTWTWRGIKERLDRAVCVEEWGRLDECF